MSVVSVEQPNVLATIAHELRNPLSALQTTSELLDRDLELLDQAQVRSMVSSIHRRALWLRGLMENLLTAATVRDGHLQVVRRPIDLRTVVDDARPIVEPLLARKQQQLRVRARAALPIVIGDERRIAQVLINLVTNASTYAGINTRIDLTLTARGGAVRVVVGDRGPGIAADVAARLFEPYFRAGRTDGDGIGIGLSVVRSIVEAHGGRVGVKNRAGGGASFWFEIPAIAASALATSGVADYERSVG